MIQSDRKGQVFVPTLAAELARFACETSWEDLPSKVIENTKLAIMDTLGSALAGDQSQSVRIARRLATQMGGKHESTLWGAGTKVPLLHAAWANAIMADAMAISESHLIALGHICGPTVPAALGTAEKVRSGGRSVILATAVGYEVAGRIGSFIAPGFDRERGFKTSIVTIFGAAVASGKVLGLSQDAMAHSIALAASSASGIAVARNSNAREYMGGNSSLLGVAASLAALNGFRGFESILECPEGYCEVFGTKGRPDRGILEELGVRWGIVEHMGLKLLPGSHGIHSVLEATQGALKVIRTKLPDFDVQKITRIIVQVPRWCKKEYEIYRPSGPDTALLSIPYLVARVIMNGRSNWNDLSASAVADTKSWPVQDKVEIVEDPAQEPYNFPGVGTVTIYADGHVGSHRIQHPLGSPLRGSSRDGVLAKFKSLAPQAGLSKKQINNALSLLNQLEGVPDVRELTQEIVAKH